MERPRLEGTPNENRTKAYVFPTRSRRLLWASLGAAGVIALVTIALFFAGARRTLSPGPLVSQHAGFEVKCAQCHEPGHAVTAVRCERCHDPSNSERLTHAAHILIGTGDPTKVAQANEKPCQTCHVEHRGALAQLRVVDNRECAACHKNPETGGGLRTFSQHPEFAIVKAGATPGVGMKFSHKVHLDELIEKGRGETCSVCHDATPDRKTFQPMTFDRHCSNAGCHLENGFLPYKTDLVDITPLTPPADVPRDVLGDSQPDIRADSLGEAVISRLRHRDGWALFNALRLRTGIDPEGEKAERLTLRGQIGYLEALLRTRPIRQVPSADLATAIESLERDIAGIDARLAQPARPDGQALAELAEASRAVARQLRGLDAPLDPDLDALSGAASETAPSAASAAGNDVTAFERRKAELVAVLNAIEARAGDTRLRERAASLRSQVGSLSPARAGDADPAPLLQRLDELDGVLRSLGAIPDAGVQAELGRLDSERRYGQQQISAGLAPDDFETRRREMLAVLDTIEAGRSDTLRPRTTVLRQRLLALRPGSTGDEELRRVRRQRQRQLERLRLELELMQSPRDQEPAPAGEAALVDRRGIDTVLRRLRASLTTLESIPPLDRPEDQETLAARRTSFRSLLTGPCTKCHVIDDVRGRLTPVRIAEPVMPRSVFNHAPHLKRVSCEACHGARVINPADPAPKGLLPNVWRSTDARDVNVPGKALCATCHAPFNTKDTCETCHVYHASSPARLIAVNP